MCTRVQANILYRVLTFNTSPEYAGHNLAYDSLKEAIYRLEKQSVSYGEPSTGDLESAGLLAASPDAPNAQDSPAVKIFSALLDKELEKISSFQASEQKKLMNELDAVRKDIVDVEESDWRQIEQEQAGGDESDDEGPDLFKKVARRLSIQPNTTEPPHLQSSPSHTSMPKRPRTFSSSSRGSNGEARDGSSTGAREDTVWWSNSDWAVDTRITFKLRLQALYRELSQLKEYLRLNMTGFRKITKKFDKITNNDLLSSYMPKVKNAEPFLPKHVEEIDQALDEVVEMYAKVTRSEPGMAIKSLRTQLREHVVFERNSVWREMIGIHSRGFHQSTPVVQGLQDGKDSTSQERHPLLFLPPKQMAGLVLGLGLFAILLLVPVMDRPEEQNCLALLALASVFWALEVIPLFATSLSIPLLVVLLRVIRSPTGERLGAPAATKFIFGQMFSPTIMLLIGGFTLASALSKHNIDKMLATRVLAFAGSKPRTVLLAYMGVACFASMWISNVAAPVLCFSLIQPILRTLPPKTPYASALILGIALASNVGGMSSPISSPQNLIALEYMNPQPSWLVWFAIALPVSALSVLLIGGLLMWSYAWDRGLYIAPARASKDKFTKMQWFVCVISLLTIVLWCFSHSIEDIFGDMGVIAIIPLVAFYGSGALRKTDFESYPWAIVFLAMGGISLGKAVLSSGLLDDIDEIIQKAVAGLDIWPILALSSIVCLVIATFVSHTVASVLLVPVAAQIGSAMEIPHPNLLVMSTALICSAGMGLPISGFPNMTAINLENDIGLPYLSTTDFLRNGIPASVLATGVIITVGYLLMTLIGL